MAVKSTLGSEDIGSAATLNKIRGVAKDVSHIPAIQYGRVMEEAAKRTYKRFFFASM